MAARRFNPRLIKLHRSYSVEEASLKLGAHKNSVRSWIKRGLPTLEDTRPVIILGRDLRAYLEGTRKAAKRPCPSGTIYCFKCRAPRAPALDMVDFVPRNARTGNLKALCDTCGGLMHRAASHASLPAILPGIAVTIIDGSGAHKLAAPPLPKL